MAISDAQGGEHRPGISTRIEMTSMAPTEVRAGVFIQATGAVSRRCPK